MEDAAEHATVSYQVLARTTSGQEIEVEHEDGDDQSFSRYRATATGVEPVSTRYGAVSRGIMMGAMAEGFAIAFVLYVFARIVKFVLRRRLAPPSPQP
jgi:hypothetical protein